MKKLSYVYVIALMLITGAYFTIRTTHTNNSNNHSINVALVPCEGISIISANPATVADDGTVSFDVKFAEGYQYIATDNCSYNNGRLVFSGITHSKSIYYNPGRICNISINDTTNGTVTLLNQDKILSGDIVNVSIQPQEHYLVNQIFVNDTEFPIPADNKLSFTATEDCNVKVDFIGEDINFMTMSNGLGVVKFTGDNMDFHYGDTISLTCDYDTSKVKFLGWSIDNYLDEGGSIICDARDYTFTITDETIIYANFKNRSTFNIHIDSNGGSMAGSVDILDKSPNTYLNLPIDNGTITRKGYTLIGYNSEPDYSGAHYSLGAMYKVTSNDITLYAEWVANTPSEYFIFKDGAILGLNANAPSISTLCIPKTINGKKVRTIADGAFRSRPDITTLIVPNGVTNIGNAAFADCSLLSLMYLPETLTALAANAFDNCPALTHMRVLASLDRVFDYDYDSIMADKYMLLKNTPGKRIIVVGGSSVTFGLNSSLIDKRFKDYSVINFSCSYHNGILPLMDMLEANIHSGDIVIWAPEYYATTYGSDEPNRITNWQFLESNYDILEDLNLQRNTMLLPNYVPYLERKVSYLPGKHKNKDSTYVRSGINAYGDLIVARTNKGFYNPKLPTAELITDLGMSRYSECSRILTERGATCLFSFPPMSRGELSRDAIASGTADFTKALTSILNPDYCTIISKVSDYCFEPKYYYDNMYHLTLAGADIRTKQLIRDLELWGGAQ